VSAFVRHMQYLELGEALVGAMDEGATQRECARELGISQGTVSKLIRWYLRQIDETRWYVRLSTTDSPGIASATEHEGSRPRGEAA
jgi:hypothetical protein